jgi:hypothetical protein
VWRRIFGPKRDEMTGTWRKLHNEELRDLYSSLSKIRMIRSRRMKSMGHVVQMGRREHIQVVSKKAREKEPARKTKT